MKKTFGAGITLAVFASLLLLPTSQYASAVAPSVTVNATFLTCCYGFVQVSGYVTNLKQGVDEVQAQVYAPNGQLILDHKIMVYSSGYFQDGFGISRDQGKGNYLIIATYLQHFSVQTELPSWINNDPVVYVSAWEDIDGSVFVQGRVENGIAGEEVSVVIVDPNNSNTATYTLTTSTKAQFQLFIDSTEAKQAFPTSGDYSIMVTHIPTGVTGTTVLTYAVYQSDPNDP